MSTALRGLVRLNTTFPHQASRRARALVDTVVQYSAVDGGGFYVAGTVQIDATPDVPVSRRVRLFEALTARIVRETWSAADGAYSFTKIRAGTYFVTAHDHTLEHGAVIRDRIEAVPMVAA